MSCSAEIYHQQAMQVGTQALSMWNRDPASPSYGSFDRPFWGWKFKDFGDATLQYAVRLALYRVQQDVPHVASDWLDAWVHHCASIQHRDGSFDQCYPFERTPGVVLDILSTLVHVLESDLVTGPSRSRLEQVAARAADFALRTDERHGEVANHLIQYAAELGIWGRHCGDRRATQRARAYVDRFMKLFNREEGWFNEYAGPDAGYQTRALSSLVKVADVLDEPRLWSVASRAARFVATVMMPDDSIHPMLGVRSTALLYPSGFEVLARRDPEFGPLASRVRRAWCTARVPLPTAIDFNNAIRLATDGLDAWHVGRGREYPESEFGGAVSTHLPEAGLHILRSASTAVYVASRLGGTVVVYARQVDGSWCLRHENAGYLLRFAGKRAPWVSRSPAAGQDIRTNGHSVSLTARFTVSLHDEMTPARMVVLRILNLTVLRAQWLADLFRKVVVRRLMLNQADTGLWLSRTVSLVGDEVRITDRIEGAEMLPSPESMELLRCRRVTGIHMASSRYFQSSETALPDTAWCEHVVLDSDGDGDLSTTIIGGSTT